MRDWFFLNYVVFVVYMVMIAGISLFFYLRVQKNTKEYFLAGRSMGWLPVGLSLMASLASGIGFIGFPAGAYKFGLITLWALMAIPLSFPIVVWIFMPFYHRLKIYTAYEYFERRFDVRVRCLASGFFIVWRVTWMAAIIYVTSLVLNIVTDGGIPLKGAIIVMGTLTTAYTALGGARAIMWADVLQFLVMLTGMILTAVMVTMKLPGGLPELWHSMQAAGKTSLVAHVPGWDAASLFGKMKLYLYVDVTALSLIVTSTVGKLGYYCVDQVMVQRYLTARDLKTSRNGFLCNCFAYCIYILMLSLVGAGLFVFAGYGHFPKTLRNDYVFPYFITHVMPAGAAGLVASAIFGASMSCMYGGMNSVITALTNDFYNRLWKRHKSLEDATISQAQQRHYVLLARVATVVLGITETTLAWYVGKMGDDMYELSKKLLDGFSGPMFGIFILAMFSRRAHAIPVLMGGLAGIVILALTVFGDKINLLAFDIGFLWPGTVSAVSTVVLGYLLSFIIPAPAGHSDRWTFRNVMRNPQD